MKRLVLVLAILAAPGCQALGLSSSLEAQATLANQANVQALVAENGVYTAADATLADSAKQARAARNAEAVKLAANLVGAGK